MSKKNNAFDYIFKRKIVNVIILYLFLFFIMAQSKTEKHNSFVVLGGGCFWCIEAMFEEISGVIDVESGYSGGKIENPTYKEVCSGSTGHAEVVRIEFDPKSISYKDLVDMFWTAHDPTTKNRQGADVGTQYRSIILYSSNEEKLIALESLEEAKELFNDEIQTEIVKLEKFYKAEDSHQDYYRLNPAAPYCVYNISPKLQKFRKNNN